MQKKRVFVVVNEGVHPITEFLKNQYGSDITIEVVTWGNVSMEEDRKIADRVKEIAHKYSEVEFVLVPSGLPYIITLIYNTLHQVTSRHPVYLQFDREKINI
ncbi:MAG: hypothetical protein ACTSQ8_20680 [Candidatus Helarchaeota archaeon]